MYTIICVMLGLFSRCHASENNGVKSFVLQTNAINMPAHFIREEPEIHNIVQYNGAAQIGDFNVRAFFTIAWYQDGGSLARDVYNTNDSDELIGCIPVGNIKKIQNEKVLKNANDTYSFIQGTYDMNVARPDGSFIQKMLMALCSYIGSDSSSSLILLSIPHPNPQIRSPASKQLSNQIRRYFQDHVLVCTEV